MEHLFFTQRLLATLPESLSLFLVFWFCTPCGQIYFITEKVDGMHACVARTGQVGEPILAIILAIGIEVLKRHPMLNAVETSPWFHVPLMLVAGGIAFVLLRSGMEGAGKRDDDRFHSTIAVPVFFYLVLGVALPAIVTAGNWYERLAAGFLVLFFFALLASDVLTGRLWQPDWKRKHGFPVAPE